MKHLTTILLLLLFCANTFAQNVGIGETNPTESKLQVKTADSAALLIQNTATPNGTKTGFFLKSDGNYSGSIATVKTAAQTYRMGLYTFGGATASALQERVSILDNGNVGIGTTNPTAKLEVAGTLKIADGTQGVDKVLTSDAAGNASWVNAAYGNTERFSHKITASGADINTISTHYLFGTSTTSYTSGNDFFRINITKSGLYHFDLNASQTCGSDYSVTSTTPRTLEISYNTGVFTTVEAFAPFLKGNFGFSYASYDKSFELYFTGPSYIEFRSVKQAVNISYRLNVSGHLISE